MAKQVKSIDKALWQFATVRALEIFEAVEKHGGQRAAARALGIDHSAVSQAIDGTKKKAQAKGYSPEHKLIHPPAPGFRAKGHSQLYRRGEAEPLLTWVKTREDEEAQERMLREAVAALMQDVPRVKPTKGPGRAAEHLCNVFTLTDSHVGMLAWARETGAAWDIKIAESTLVGAVEHLVRACPGADTAVIAQLGDFMHFDSLEPVTVQSKHVLSADTRFSKMVQVAVKILREAIQLALVKHRRVIVLMAEGNHDMASSVWLRHLFALLFENEPRVTVIDSELPYYAFQHGETMLAWHHGHLKKMDQLPLLLAAQFPVMWGATKHRSAHMGHLHHKHIKEFSGITVVQHATIAARDGYAARGGWIAEREMTAYTYHSRDGQVASVTVSPEMLEPA